MREIGHAIDLFIAELSNRRCSLATRQTYFRIIVAFADTLPSRYLEDIRTEHVRGHLKGFADRECKPATVAHQISVLNSFFAFCLDEGAIDTSPMGRIHRPRVPAAEEREVVTVDATGVQMMLAACRTWPEIVCLNLIAYTGIRRAAAARLRWRDVDTSRGVIRFVEKGPAGGKVIEKPIADELAKVLIAGIQNGGLVPEPDAYVIPYRQPKKVRSSERTGRLVYNIVHDVAARAGVRAHVHALRGAFAVQFLDANPDQLLALQTLLGHSRIETTLVYLRRADRRKEMERVRTLSWNPSAAHGGHVSPEAVPPRPVRDGTADGVAASRSGSMMADLAAARRNAENGPGGLRSRVSALKGQRPSPLDDRAASDPERTIEECDAQTGSETDTASTFAGGNPSTDSSKKSVSGTPADAGSGSDPSTARDTDCSARGRRASRCSHTDGRTSTSEERSQTGTTSTTSARPRTASTPITSRRSPDASTYGALERAAWRDLFPSERDPLGSSVFEPNAVVDPHVIEPVFEPNPPEDPSADNGEDEPPPVTEWYP